MISIRKGCFETNSSSSHSVCIHNNELVDCELPNSHIVREYDDLWPEKHGEHRCFIVELTTFVDEDTPHTSQNDRLALLCLTVCQNVMSKAPWNLSKEEWNEYFQTVYRSQEWLDLEYEISVYFEYWYHIRIKQYSEGFIDTECLFRHYQDFLNTWKLKSVADYVFAKDVETFFEFVRL